MRLTLDSVSWIVLVLFLFALAIYFFRMFRRDGDRRKLMFSLAFFLAVFHSLYMAGGYRDLAAPPLLLHNLYRWSALPVLSAVFIAVNESLFKANNFNRWFWAYLVFVAATMAAAFLPWSLVQPSAILIQALSIEIVGVLVYLLIKKRSLVNGLFLMAVCCYIIAGLALTAGISYMPAYSFFVGHVCVVLTFIIAARLPAATDGRLGAYFARILDSASPAETLEQLQAQYELIVKNMSEAVVLTTPQGEIIYMSPSGFEITGYTTAEIAGPWQQQRLIHPDDAAGVFAAHRQALDKTEEVNLEYRIWDKAGTEKWVHQTLSPVLTRNKISVVVSTLKDISERKLTEREIREKNERLDAQNEELLSQSTELISQRQELEVKTRQLQDSSQAKSDFLASMSHELRTPLNAIIGFSELMRDGICGEVNDEQRQCAADIMNGGQHLLSLINGVLDMSKIEAGRMEIKPGNTAVGEVISDALTTLSPLFKEKEIQLEEDIPAGLPEVYADAQRFHQVLLNLLGNAIKFTGKGGMIKVGAAYRGDGCQIDVSDSGVGIRKADQRRIFEPFIQAEAISDAEQRQGTGLGLKLSQQFVELMGGRIWVKSEYGRGSTFSFTLPLAQPGPEVEGTILVVDDDAATRKLFRKWLENAGYGVSEAAGGEEALRRVKEISPSLIILDLMMPFKNGWQVLIDLKSDAKMKQIPVIISSIAEEKEKGFVLGAADYFVKPVNKKALLSTIAKLGIIPGRAVLVVDDNPADVRLAAAILEADNIGVIKAYSGEEAIRLARDKKPALIVLDIMMPEVSGFEVIAALRKSAGTRDIPIVVLTSKDLSAAEADLLYRQTASVIKKAAFNRKDFINNVKRLLQTQGG